MDKGEHPDPIKDLDSRLKQAKSQQIPEEGRGSKFRRAEMKGLSYAFRVGTELVSALVVGLGIGWGLDTWLETKPWFMIVFFFIGSGAGILNVYRATTGIGMAPGYGELADEADADKGDKPDESDKT